MKSVWLLWALVTVTGCRKQQSAPAAGDAQGAARIVHGTLARAGLESSRTSASAGYIGFDRNLYPGDDRLAELRKSFAFAGFWLNNPPGESTNTWAGKRGALRQAGFGFLVLANGRLDAEIQRAQVKPADLGQRDAEEAIAAATREGFPDRTLIFLDQEEGGRLLPEQAAYFFAWTEAVAGSRYRAGAYLSGQASPDGTGPDGQPLMITTAQDVREQIAQRHLHPVAFWVQQDACPPAPGCTLAAPRVSDSGTQDAPVWQYAQSPRRPEITHACAATYGSDGLCYAGATKDLFVDLDVADSADPSQGR